MAQTMTAEQAARRLGITLRTLWRWRAKGKIAEAPKAGRTAMFYVADVDALAREAKVVPPVADMSLAQVYSRLMTAETWEDVDEIRRDAAAAICAHAKDKTPVEAAYSAACSMAATHPHEDARGRWEETARRYGTWLAIPADETRQTIRNRERAASFVTFESAQAELEAAPRDPAWAVAVAELGAGGPTSHNSDCEK